jgi:hypothetical protein
MRNESTDLSLGVPGGVKSEMNRKNMDDFDGEFLDI